MANFGIIRIQKFKATAVRGIQIHNRREKESRTNPDIDPKKSAQNVTLIACDNFKAAIRERLETLEKKTVRKDAVVMAQAIITASPDWFEGTTQIEQSNYFQKSLEFIKKTYGENNIFSAVIHMDERTPHLHIDFTPIEDKKLTAKTIFSRDRLRNLQSNFYKEVSKDFGLERGEIKEERRKHLSTEEYKIKMRKEELEKNIETLKDEIEYITPEEVKPIKKGFFSKETDESIAERLNKKIEPFKDLKTQIKVLNKKIKNLEYDNQRLEKIVKSWRKDFEGLNADQMFSLQNKAAEFRRENAHKAEKARIAAIEAKKEKIRQEQARLEKEREEAARAAERASPEAKAALMVFERLMASRGLKNEERKVQAEKMLEDWIDAHSSYYRHGIVDRAEKETKENNRLAREAKKQRSREHDRGGFER